MRLWIFIILVFQTICLNGFSQNTKSVFYVLKSPLGEGLFNVLKMTLGSLKMFEEHPEKVKGLKIDFGTDGLYYDANYGENWWEYYFEPVELGSSVGSKVVNVTEIGSGIPYYLEKHTSIERVNELLSKYVKVKEPILRKVQELKNTYFHSYMIGVHYRGTDKNSEVRRVKYETVLKAIKNHVQSSHLKDFCLFIATDEQQFIDFMKKQFPNQIIYYEEAFRSWVGGEAIHLSKKYNPYKKGEDAMIDCLLLSQCDFLIRTTSNLSLCSTYFNPSLKVLLLK